MAGLKENSFFESLDVCGSVMKGQVTKLICWLYKTMFIMMITMKISTMMMLMLMLVVAFYRRLPEKTR